MDERPLPDALADDAAADALARRLALRRVQLASAAVEPAALQRVPEKLARKHGAVPLHVTERELVMAMANPQDVTALQDFEFATGLKIVPVVATRSEIEAAISQHYTPEDRVRESIAHVADTPDFRVLRYGSDEESGDDFIEPAAGAVGGAETTPVVKVCNLMMYDGIQAGASDIHVEPAMNEVTIRFRVDGALRSYTHFPRWLHEPVVSRLKILARIDIAERRVPQDGRIKVVHHGRAFDLRVSTLPTHFGEKMVLRILGGGRVPGLETLGFGAALHQVEKALGRAQGMILATGPTGSGKTTTLYSMLDRVRSGERNIITIEDPIEYQLDGVNQVQINPKAGLTFSSALRSILRQDPDVMLLGEIRDLETAEIAFQAALTGHLVLSTIHTNSATATIARLFDLGVDPVVVSSALSLVVAQRLVRRLCPQCLETYTPDPRALESFGLSPTATYRRGRGCRACGNTGYSGRMGVYEVLPTTAAVKALIHRRAPDVELREAAARDGMRPLGELAVEAVRAGLTTPEEILRVVEPAHDDAPSVPTGRSSKQLRILVVDDDPMTRRAVAAALTQLDGLTPTVMMANDGIEAIEAVAHEVPDLVILDLMMPRAGGLEVCQQLRSDVRTAFVPVLMLTRSNDEATRTKGFVAGTDDFMNKPFAVPELAVRVRRLLRRTYGI